MDAFLDRAIFRFDTARGLLLRKTLRSPLARRLFTDRALRLSIFFALACAIYLPLSLFLPAWVAVLGPIMYGLPHIVASFRFSRVETSRGLKSFFVAVWTLVTILRVAIDMELWNYSESFTTLEIEFASWILSFAILWFCSARSWKSLAAGSALLAVILGFAWHLPIEVGAFLLLFHNFVAFFYWIRDSRVGRDRVVAAACTAVFCALSAMILLGAFDGLYWWLPPQGSIDIFDFDYADLGQSLAPWSEDYRHWFRFFVAYVFGQSLHYFVWLKAIPEQHLKTQTPVSFRATLNALSRDYGRRMAWVLLVACLASLGVWLMFAMPQARVIYFAIASYHGFYELAALPLRGGTGASV